MTAMLSEGSISLGSVINRQQRLNYFPWRDASAALSMNVSLSDKDYCHLLEPPFIFTEIP